MLWIKQNMLGYNWITILDINQDMFMDIYKDKYGYSDLIQVGVNVPVFLCHSSKKEPSESVRAAGRFSPAAPACPYICVQN